MRKSSIYTKVLDEAFARNQTELSTLMEQKYAKIFGSSWELNGKYSLLTKHQDRLMALLNWMEHFLNG